MADEEKTSIIKEALADLNAIREAAELNAMKRLAQSNPNNFDKLLKEELNKNKKAKESYKKIDDAEESEQSDKTKLKNESDMKNQANETVKVVDTVGKGEPFEKKVKGGKPVEEDVHIKKGGGVTITDTIGKSDPFSEKKKGQKIEEEREKDFMGDVESDTPNQAKGETGKGVAFKEKIKPPTVGKPISNLKEEFNISELDMSTVGTALDNADEEDEIITIDEIEEEIQGMSGLPRPELQKRGEPLGQTGDAYQQLVSMRNQIDEMLKGMNPEEESAGMEEEGMEEGDDITTADIESVLGSAPEEEEEEEESYAPEEEEEEESYLPEQEEEETYKPEIEEALGVSHATNKITTAHNPRPAYASSPAAVERRRPSTQGMYESKKFNSLIEENKKLTKKLNETKKLKDSATSLVESYKTALEKYRNQLKEMAVFNTNLAHVNNLLVNESLALTQDDKIKIINGFKKVDSITESQNVYKTFLTEMNESGKKTISEGIKGKVSASIQPSSKQKLDEVVEKTAYSNNEHVSRMKNLIEYVEKRGKK
jgi:hypothetical protein